MSKFWQQHNTLYNNWLRSWWCQRSDNNTIHCTTTDWEVGDVNILTTTQYTVQQLVDKLVMSTFWQQHNTLYNNWLRSWWCQRSDNNTIHCTTTGREVGDVNVLTTTQYTVQQLIEKLVMSTFWQQHNTLYNNWLRSWWCQRSDNNTIHCRTTGREVGDVNVLTTTQYTVQQLVEKLVMSTFWQQHNTQYNNWLGSWWCQRSDNNTIHSTTTGREVGDVNVLTTTQYTVQQLVEKLVMSTFWQHNTQYNNIIHKKGFIQQHHTQQCDVKVLTTTQYTVQQLVEKLVMSTFWQQHNTLYNNWLRSWRCQRSDNNTIHCTTTGWEVGDVNVLTTTQYTVQQLVEKLVMSTFWQQHNTLYNNWLRSWWCQRSDNNTIHCRTTGREVGDVNVLTTTQYTVQQLIEKLVMSTFWQQHNTLYNNWLRSWWCQRSDNNTIHCRTTGREVGDVNVLTTTQYTVQQLVEKLVMSTFWQQHNTQYNNWLGSWWCQRSDNNTMHSTTTGREVGDVNVLTTTQYTVQQLVEKLVMSTFWQHNTPYNNIIHKKGFIQQHHTQQCDVKVLTTTQYTVQQLVEKLVMSTFWQQHNTLYNN